MLTPIFISDPKTALRRSQKYRILIIVPQQLRITPQASDTPLIAQSRPPELGLLAAIILRAIDDLIFPGKLNTYAIQRAAKIWICNSTTTKPFSFYWCCTHLNLDPIALKKSILLKHKNKSYIKIRYRLHRYKDLT